MDWDDYAVIDKIFETEQNLIKKVFCKKYKNNNLLNEINMFHISCLF